MAFDHKPNPADYIVTLVLLLAPLGIGVWFAIKDARRSTRDEFLLGGRKLAMLRVALSIFVTFMSAISLMGYPTDVYTYGAMVTTVFVGFSCSYVIGLFTTTAGIPYWMSVTIIGGIGTVYSAIGGIKSVVWANAFHAVVLIGALIPSIVKACLAVGGAGVVWRIATEGERTSFNVLSPDPRERHTWWGTVIGGIFMWLVNIFNQSSIQKICSMKTMKDAKQSYVLNIIIIIIYGALLYSVGICIYAYFTYMRCDPFEAGLITNRNQLPPYFVLQALSDLPGMAGLYMTVIFGSSLSTFSSGINALATTTVEDVLMYNLRIVEESTATLITKLIVFVFGITVTCLAYVAQTLKGPVTQMGFSTIGACGGPILGVFFLGASIPRSNKYGAMVGGVIALVLNMWLAIGKQLYGREATPLPAPPVDMCLGNRSSTLDTNKTNIFFHNVTVFNDPVVDMKITQAEGENSYSSGNFMYDISYLWYGVIGFLTSFLIGCIVSLCCINIQKHSDPDLRLIFPCIRQLCYQTPVLQYKPGKLYSDETYKF